MRRWTAAVVAGLGLAAVVGGGRVDDIPFSPVFGRGRIGADFGARRGLAGAPARGETENFDAFARDDFDPDCVHPEISVFYEEASAYRMWYDVRWHPGFRVGATAAARVTSRLEQLNLPGSGEFSEPREVDSDLRRVPDGVDPREDVRLWTRTDSETNEAVFVALYGAHDHEGERFVNVAVPLPGCNLSTVLRPQHLGAGDATAFELTTFAPGQPGLFAVTPAGAYRLPMQQRFRTYPADAPGAPALAVPGLDLVTTQELWFAGRQFLTVTYGMCRE